MAKPFKVLVTSTVVREFEIDANTPEEAESVAEQFISDGDLGVLISDEVEYSEALPIEELEVA